MSKSVDITFDFRSDTPGYPKRDPDAVSPTLREYHKILWSKPLPKGKCFDLDDITRWAYLHHQSALGEFFLTSDTMNQSYGNVRRLAHIRDQIPEAVSQFRTLVYFIGNMIVFPGRRIDRNMTINQARGCNNRVGDRFDLTLECIRRHYLRVSNPLADDLMRFDSFFHLFEDFAGYVDFFLLNDLVTADYSAVNFFLPFTDFGHPSPYPSNVDDFTAYLREAGQFIVARNNRILQYSRGKG